MRGLTNLRQFVIGSVVLLSLAACSEEAGRAVSAKNGDVAPQPPSSAEAPQQPSPPAAGEPEQNESLKSINPCGLLSESQLAELADNLDFVSTSGKNCRWSNREAMGADDDFFMITVRLRPGQSVDELDIITTGSTQTGEVDGRPAKIIVADAGEGQCTLGFAAGSGRVDIYTTSTAGTERACVLADRAAEMIEPKLPEPVS